MRLSIIRSSALAAVAAIVLAACGGHGVVPGSSSVAPMSANGGAAPITNDAAAMTNDGAPMADSDMTPLGLTTCAKNPPQWMWIFKGACEKFTLKPTGGKFSLGAYDSISVTGSIGYNSAKGSVSIYLVDALNKNGDILKNKGKAFPPYKGKGTTVVYAVADNQSTQTIKPLSHKNVPILKYVITDQKGFPGKNCAAAILAKQRNGTFAWSALPSQFPVKGKTVTITQYTVPQGLELPPKGTGLYFAINCF
ncbi:MAG: hypothetical protein WB609_14675 [Candidatus Cybelea sp.]